MQTVTHWLAKSSSSLWFDFYERLLHMCFRCFISLGRIFLLHAACVNFHSASSISSRPLLLPHLITKWTDSARHRTVIFLFNWFGFWCGVWLLVRALRLCDLFFWPNNKRIRKKSRANVICLHRHRDSPWQLRIEQTIRCSLLVYFIPYFFVCACDFVMSFSYV